MRVVRNEWGPSTYVFIESKDFEDLIRAIMGGTFDYQYAWDAKDEMFKFTTRHGHRFLDRVHSCRTDRVVKKLDQKVRQDAATCLTSLKIIESSWRGFLDDGFLEAWIDG
jgi:hypothetical protein